MEEFNIEKMSKAIIRELNKVTKNVNRLNIMVLGKSGVGKSTLINNMFNEPLAETGVGSAVTQKIVKYEKNGLPLSVYDTPGLELSGENAQKEIQKKVNRIITDGIRTGDASKAIHCILYCVSSSSHRFEDAEKVFIDKFTSEASKYNVPVIVVLTKSFSDNDVSALKSEIDKENLNIVDIVPVLAEDYPLNKENKINAFGLDTLAEVIESVIPETVRDTFITLQKVNLKIKQRKAQGIVVATTLCITATSFAPIPFSDLMVSIPMQETMLFSITKLFGLPIEKATISALISSSIGISATAVGGGILTNIIKLIPGVGTVVGGVIGGSAYAAITAALGEAYIGIMSSILKGEMKVSDLETSKGKNDFVEMFKKQLSIKRNRRGKAID